MSTLRTRIAEALTQTKPPLEKWLDGLEAEDREQLELVRYDKTAIPTTRLHRIMKDAGCPVGEKTITAWRDSDNG